MNKQIYLILAVIGFIIPTYLVILESMETGNILLYTNPKATIEAMMTNRITTIFSIDLLAAVLVFFIWSFLENKRRRIKYTYSTWLVTILFGLASGFPFFLYLRELNKEA